MCPGGCCVLLAGGGGTPGGVSVTSSPLAGRSGGGSPSINTCPRGNLNPKDAGNPPPGRYHALLGMRGWARLRPSAPRLRLLLERGELAQARSAEHAAQAGGELQGRAGVSTAILASSKERRACRLRCRRAISPDHSTPADSGLQTGTLPLRCVSQTQRAWQAHARRQRSTAKLTTHSSPRGHYSKRGGWCQRGHATLR